MKAIRLILLSLLSMGIGNIALAYPVINYPHGFYVGAGMNYGRIAANRVRHSGGNRPMKKDEFYENSNPGYILDAGYTFASLIKFPVSLELAYTKNHDYQFRQNPLFADTASDSMESTIKTYTMMLNGYVGWNVFKYFMPFLTAGVGVSRNFVSMHETYLGFTTEKYVSRKSRHNVAYQAGIGMRFKIINNVFLNLEYLHAELGKAQWGPWVGNRLKTNRITTDKALLTVSVYFGNQREPMGPAVVNAY